MAASIYQQTGDLHEGVPRYTNGTMHLYYNPDKETWNCNGSFDPTDLVIGDARLAVSGVVIPMGVHSWSCWLDSTFQEKAVTTAVMVSAPNGGYGERSISELEFGIQYADRTTASVSIGDISTTQAGTLTTGGAAAGQPAVTRKFADEYIALAEQGKLTRNKFGPASLDVKGAFLKDWQSLQTAGVVVPVNADGAVVVQWGHSGEIESLPACRVWVAGDRVDIETADGTQQVEVLGPATSGDESKMSVKFANGGLVRDWKVASRFKNGTEADVEEYMAQVRSRMTNKWGVPATNSRLAAVSFKVKTEAQQKEEERAEAAAEMMEDATPEPELDPSSAAVSGAPTEWPKCGVRAGGWGLRYEASAPLGVYLVNFSAPIDQAGAIEIVAGSAGWFRTVKNSKGTTPVEFDASEADMWWGRSLSPDGTQGLSVGELGDCKSGQTHACTSTLIGRLCSRS
jgi:hypothetical protein